MIVSVCLFVSTPTYLKNKSWSKFHQCSCSSIFWQRCIELSTSPIKWMTTFSWNELFGDVTLHHRLAAVCVRPKAEIPREDFPRNNLARILARISACQACRPGCHENREIRRVLDWKYMGAAILDFSDGLYKIQDGRAHVLPVQNSASFSTHEDPREEKFRGIKLNSPCCTVLAAWQPQAPRLDECLVQGVVHRCVTCVPSTDRRERRRRARRPVPWRSWWRQGGRLGEGSDKRRTPASSWASYSWRSSTTCRRPGWSVEDTSCTARRRRRRRSLDTPHTTSVVLHGRIYSVNGVVTFSDFHCSQYARNVNGSLVRSHKMRCVPLRCGTLRYVAVRCVVMRRRALHCLVNVR